MTDLTPIVEALDEIWYGLLVISAGVWIIAGILVSRG